MPTIKEFAVFYSLTLIYPYSLAACDQPVKMRSYSVCLPGGWHIDKERRLDQVVGCNRANGECTGTGGGLPLRGVVVIHLMPAENVPNHPAYSGPLDIVSAVPHASSPAPEIASVALDLAGRTAQSKCFVARRLWSWAGVWDEVYGLEVDKRFFRAWVQYQDEPAKIEEYRAAVRTILSSVSLNSR
jgi:hypothetical protein